MDDIGAVFDAGLKSDVIEQRGSHYYDGLGDGDGKLGQGRDNCIELLKNNEQRLK